MVYELKEAVKKAEKLPNKDQKAIALIILDEWAWSRSFINSQKKLSKLAEEALVEYRKGDTKPLEL